MSIEATLIVRAIHLDKVAALFTSGEIEVTNRFLIDCEGTTKLQISGMDRRGDFRLEMILEHLRQQDISYSYYWREPICKSGGEFHFRSNGTDVQHLSWMDHEKDVVNIEDVRQALAQGETAVLELLESLENRFTPWDWQEVAA
ncbi:hypothetical protein [Microbulbifer sp. THAF38]|uniref:hypothetical protein n=1 Tax=Microbulbifer sp. THAF38 TaxID=2587856 RepID=UPI00126807E5|nr:hypothetical protein [Microbulbifer sp. THAF38]QFT57057.1 hypothetical protein FIU95_21130 [Microbulbifer sp. THAF38]